MKRPRLLPGQAEVVEQPEHPVLAVGDPETRLDDPAEVLGPPGAHSVALGIGTAQDQGDAGIGRRSGATTGGRPWEPADRADRAEQADRLVAQVAHPARAQALLVPPSAEATGLADPGFVEEPDLEPLGFGMIAGDLGDQVRVR